MNARLTILGTLVALSLLSGCASVETSLSGGGEGTNAGQEDILQVMERDSRGG